MARPGGNGGVHWASYELASWTATTCNDHKMACCPVLKPRDGPAPSSARQRGPARAGDGADPPSSCRRRRRSAPPRAAAGRSGHPGATTATALPTPPQTARSAKARPMPRSTTGLVRARPSWTARMTAGSWTATDPPARSMEEATGVVQGAAAPSKAVATHSTSPASSEVIFRRHRSIRVVAHGGCEQGRSRQRASPRDRRTSPPVMLQIPWIPSTCRTSIVLRFLYSAVSFFYA